MTRIQPQNTQLSSSLSAEQEDAAKEAFEATRAPLMAHMLEFRRRLMIAAVSWLGAAILCYALAGDIYNLLVEPLAAASGESARRMIYTGMAEAFLTQISLALHAAFYLAFPVIAAQCYLFLAPGLYKHERGIMLPFLIAAPVLFAMGAALCYFYVMPVAWQFFLGFEQAGANDALPIQLEARVSEYLALTLQFMTAFGLAFQLPVALMLCARVGLVTAEGLMRFRKYALILVFVAAAILTPPDVISQIALAVPLYLLYELSILGARWIGQRGVDATE